MSVFPRFDQNEELLCFRDVKPGATHHYLVITRTHIDNCKSLQRDDVQLGTAGSWLSPHTSATTSSQNYFLFRFVFKFELLQEIFLTLNAQPYHEYIIVWLLTQICLLTQITPWCNTVDCLTVWHRSWYYDGQFTIIYSFPFFNLLSHECYLIQNIKSLKYNSRILTWHVKHFLNNFILVSSYLKLWFKWW